jgi:hypothetical protein
MKAILTAIALTVASFGSFAQEVTVFEDNFVSTQSRAEVRSELFAALERGESIRHGEVSVASFAPQGGSSLTRAEVRAELFAALQRGDAIRFGEAPPAGSYDSLATGGTMLASTTPSAN